MNDIDYFYKFWKYGGRKIIFSLKFIFIKKIK